VTRLRFLLDENENPRLARALVQQATEVDVWRVGGLDAPKFGTADPEILLWCAEAGFSLVTRNRASMPVHLENLLTTGRHVPGIFVLDPDLSLGQAVAELLLIWGASEAEEYLDRLIYLPLM
jgi:Domain of unknown function (DUF5615)